MYDGKYNDLQEITTIDDISKLPEGLKISTIGISCSLCDYINIQNAYKYITLGELTIKSIKYIYKKRYWNNEIEILKRPENDKRRYFFNQASIYIHINENNVNVKYFPTVLYK